ncbi:hypothetical protein FisN_3Lh489 [Fistulifera solaris]|uniref:Mitochondrial import inner membrane translocase subunit TIM22 n=1 Tax=Fistulifera solaris TaxID=1519565 RepID=A0A1Z5J8L2_FISSO|nr:hypothetical protein FisN_3Lh489 [Fistulifera solaris]|eukprot:GAX10289.1 hypothetical protein FisN_3Lh489 [Fistulifera solaris]
MYYPVAVTGYRHRRNSPGYRRSSVLHVSRKTRQSKDPSTILPEMVDAPQSGVNDAELGPVGRIVAGAVEVAVSTGLEYMSGFLGGYTLGTVTDVPRLLFRTTNQPTLLRETSSRFVRTHSKSLKWAKTWGGISAAFGGFNVLIKVVRGGKEDDWNSILSSTAAGVFFARKEGPQGMLRAAVLYGGLMYVIHGGMLTRRDPSRYVEEPIDF